MLHNGGGTLDVYVLEIDADSGLAGKMIFGLFQKLF
jgi:hypothetical protein